MIDFIKAHPHEFVISLYTIKHSKTDLEIWICNPPNNYKFYSSTWVSDGGRNKFDAESQKVFHKFITEFVAERLEAERKEKVAAKIKMLINS